MTDLTDLTTTTSVDAGDLIYTVKDPAGTPLDRAISAEDLAASPVFADTYEPKSPTAYTGRQTLIAEQILGSDTGTIEFSSIPTTYRHLQVILMGRGSAAAVNVNVRARFNGDAAATYHFQRAYSTSTTNTGLQSLGQTSAFVGEITASTSTANWAGSIALTIPHYAGTTFFKVGDAISGHRQGATILSENVHIQWDSTAAIHTIALFPLTGNFVTGTVASLYGL